LYCVSLRRPCTCKNTRRSQRKLVSAQKLFLVNDSGDLKAYDKLYSELRKWGRFTIVTSQSTADAIVVLTSRAEYAVAVVTGTAIASGNAGTGVGKAVSVAGTYLYLKIFDAKTGEPLWSDATEKWVYGGACTLEVGVESKETDRTAEHKARMNPSRPPAGPQS
jgi:hypothetical protein